MNKKISIRDIKVGTRHRKDLGDLRPLADSIGKLGLLQPIGVTSSMQLVWGERRLRACESLGWSAIDAIIDPSLDDTLRAMTAERDENTCRKDLTPSEAVAIAAHLEAIERPRAEERLRASWVKPGEVRRAGWNPLGNTRAPNTRETVAAGVGMSHNTLSKARRVVADGTPELVGAMDRGDVSVHAASKIAALPIEKQKAVVAGGKAAIAAASASLATSPQKSCPRSVPSADALDGYPDLSAALDTLEEIAALPHHQLSVMALKEAVRNLRTAVTAAL